MIYVICVLFSLKKIKIKKYAINFTILFLFGFILKKFKKYNL